MTGLSPWRLPHEIATDPTADLTLSPPSDNNRQRRPRRPVMTSRQCSAASFIAFLSIFLLVQAFPSAGQSSKTQEPASEKIKRALSAGPPSITPEATVAEIDSDGGLNILRQGKNDFTCMPGDPAGIGMPAMCADKVAMQWNSDFAHHKEKPSTTVPGIEYMLAGATQRSDSDPFDKTSPPIPIGPHWMILWPFDPKTTGLPTTHKPEGAYIMWAGTPWAHVHVMGHP